MPHQSVFIQQSLFDRYGLYDESLIIMADWKWFTTVIGLHNEAVVYADIDIVYFDLTSISQTDLPLHFQERRKK